MKDTNKIEYLDFLRVFSMFSVIFLHTVAGSLRNNLFTYTWHFSNIMTAILGTSVPIFFMISGALLLQSKNTLSIKYTFSKRLPKAFVPFLLWSLLAVLYYLFMSYITTNSFDFKSAIDSLKNIINAPTVIHLWFMYALIPLYIISPIIKSTTDNLNNNLKIYLICIWFIFSSLIPTLNELTYSNYSFILKLNFYNLDFYGGYIGFFIIGYFLNNWNCKISINKLLLFSLLIITIISIGTYFLTKKFDTYTETYKSYSGIFTSLLSISIFLIVKKIYESYSLLNCIKRIIAFLSPLSFGIYLIHNLIVDFVSRKFNLWTSATVKIIIQSYLIVSIISIFFIFIFASIKPLSYILTGNIYSSSSKSCNLSWVINKLKKPH